MDFHTVYSYNHSMKEPKKIIGERFGRLTVIEVAGRASNRSILLRCLCDCGNYKIARQCNVVHGGTKSCGCLFWEVRSSEEMARRASFTATHGMSDTPTYSSWSAMIDRCYKTTDRMYPYYGARGILPCEYIKMSPRNLLASVGMRPKGLTLDRIDVNLGYWCGECAECVANARPKNIRWATIHQQNGNRRNNAKYCINGKTLILADWARELKISEGIFRRRYKSFRCEKLCAPS